MKTEIKMSDAIGKTIKDFAFQAQVDKPFLFLMTIHLLHWVCILDMTIGMLILLRIV